MNAASVLHVHLYHAVEGRGSLVAWMESPQEFALLSTHGFRSAVARHNVRPRLTDDCVAGGVSGEYSSSKTLSRTFEPSWNEEFKLTVKDPMNSQLECTFWDESSSVDTTQAEQQKFLGEVILNLAKLVPHNNVLIEQVFEIKQGKQHKASADDKKATGKMKLGLSLSIPEEGGAQKAPSQPRANMSD